MPRVNAPFEDLEGINENAYNVDLPRKYGVSATFNAANFSLYLRDDHLEDLRENSSQ